jgi:succinoglycan biosynthesis transport protein ExoP
MVSPGSNDVRANSSVEASALINAIRVIRERWWLVAATFVVGLVVALVLSTHTVKQYTGTATLLVRPSNLPALIDPTQAQAQDSTTLAHIQSDDTSLVTSPAVGTGAKLLLRSKASIGDLQSEVTATAEPTNDLIQIQATDPSPTRAARIANAFATSTVAYLSNSAQAQLVAGQTKLQGELAQLPAADPGRSALEQGLKQVIALEAVTNGGAQVVETAQTPSSPSSPSAKRDAAVGGLAGLVIGLLLIFLLDLFDRRVKSEEAFERLYGLSALAAIPLRRRVRAGSQASQAELEPFRILRDGLAHVSLKRDMRVVMITSAVSAEGKTRVATGLGRAIASAGKSVLLIESDVHRPAVRKEFGLPTQGPGLMNVLVEGGTGLPVIQGVPDVPFLSVLPSGPFTPNSAELLRLPAMTDLLTEFNQSFDFVIIDGAPLLPVADAQVLLDNPLIDVVLLVARPYLTTREHIRLTLPIIRRHPGKGIGLAINGVREKVHGYYGYSGAHDAEELRPEVRSGPSARSSKPSSRRGPSARADELDQAAKRN